jgi:xylulokinase
MRNYLMGIDIGTSACKVAVFKPDGTVIAASFFEYPVYYPHKGWAEQNPNEWWHAVSQAVQKIFENSNVSPADIAGIGVDGQSWSAIAIDKAGAVLTNTPIWMDTRSQNICSRVIRDIGEQNIFQVAGNSLQPSYSTAKILWYKENLPEVFNKTDKILQSNAFIVYQLTGKITTDKTQAYGLHCYDMKKGLWNEDMCKALQIPLSFLSEIKECSEVVGSVTKKAAAETGLLAGTPVVAGGLDAACGALGAGVVHVGDTQEQGGQAGGMSICLDSYKVDPRLIMSNHVVPGKWLLQGGTTGGGGTMRWFEQEFAAFERSIKQETGKSSLEQLNELAKAVPAGCEGLVFLPYLAGERSPIWNPHAKGVYYGMDFSKTKGHFVRSIMEGVAFSLHHNLVVAEAVGAKVTELLAIGGAANSHLWTQIKSDITGKPIKVPTSDTATTLGAAILAGVGTGVYRDCESAVQQTIRIMRAHQPNADNRVVYDKMYQLYIQIYQNLKKTMNEGV